MALIKCSECGNEVSDKAASCPKCGNPINQKEESKVMIYGYTENYMLNPKVKILLNGDEIGSVAKGQLFEYDITSDCEITFKCNLRKASMAIKPGRVTKIKLSWNRLTGQLVPQVIDYNTPDGSKW